MRPRTNLSRHRNRRVHETEEECHAGRNLHRGDHRLLRRRHRLHVRVREALIMENIVVGGVAVLLLVYLFVSLIRPEKF
jgi:K+-transporting ATPase KdpF subunit